MIHSIMDNKTPTSNVLVLYSSGSIGMKAVENGKFIQKPGYLSRTLSKRSQFHDTLQIPLTTRKSQYGKRIHYEILEYYPLLDDSSMELKDWQRIAKDIERNYNLYDAFIILHGIETLTYTASALSFMLCNLTKPVILTGSLKPISADCSDAIDNIYGALMISGHFQVPEVSVYFGHKLLRGNRTQRFSTEGFDAFISHKYPPLVDVGIHFDVHWNNIRPPPHRVKGFQVKSEMSQNIAVLKLYPGMTSDVIRNFLAPPLEACVLESYGAGNCPSRNDFLMAIKEAVQRGVIIVNITQCPTGGVDAAYETGVELLSTGVVPGVDMTTEAALAKIGWLLGQKFSREVIISKIIKNMRGELTDDNVGFSMSNTRLVDSFILALQNKNQDIVQQELAITMLPVLLCTASGQGNMKQLQELVGEHFEKINCKDYDARTPLHVAASEGRMEAVQFLVDNKANVNARDRWGGTPLDDAIRNGNPKVIQFLEEKGAQKQISTLDFSIDKKEILGKSN